jgi:phosphoserine aminotransferase
MSWKKFADSPSGTLNTPCTFAVYMAGLNLKYMKEKGGIPFYTEQALYKSKILNDVIDGSSGYYTNPVDVAYRSNTNIPFRVKADDVLEAKFLKEAESLGFVDLKGHRSVGGCRASIYNAMEIAGVEALANFMKQF